MNEQLRDDYLDEVAATVRSAIETAAVLVGEDHIEDGELRFGEAWEPMQRLRLRLATDQDKIDFVAVVADLVSTLAHSFLVTLDGGTALSDDGMQVFLTDRDGEEIADTLHERLFDHLDVEETVRAVTA